MLVRLSGGPKEFIEPLLIIFNNKYRNYPTKGVLYDVRGTAYRTGSMGVDEQHSHEALALRTTRYQKATK